jgi:serine/threonine protein kinase
VRGLKSEGGHWKLIDFGLSKHVANIKASQSHLSTRTIIGTPGYIAQEFERRGHMSPSCDVYSLGITLLVVITGLPVWNEEEGEAIRGAVQCELEDLKQVNENPEQALLASELATSSCDWTFEGGPAILLELINLGFQCSHPAKRRRPAISAVVHFVIYLVSVDVTCNACLSWHVYR